MKGPKKNLWLFMLATIGVTTAFAQEDQSITTFDFVQVQNDNQEEALYYYENNWVFLRKRAVEEGYIQSFEWFQVARQEDAPFDIILMTTYGNRSQFDQREVGFQRLIKEKGDRILLNDKQPAEFRRVLFSKEESKHLAK